MMDEPHFAMGMMSGLLELGGALGWRSCGSTRDQVLCMASGGKQQGLIRNSGGLLVVEADMVSVSVWHDGSFKITNVLLYTAVHGGLGMHATYGIK